MCVWIHVDANIPMPTIKTFHMFPIFFTFACAPKYSYAASIHYTTHNLYGEFFNHEHADTIAFDQIVAQDNSTQSYRVCVFENTFLFALLLCFRSKLSFFCWKYQAYVGEISWDMLNGTSCFWITFFVALFDMVCHAGILYRYPSQTAHIPQAQRVSHASVSNQ